ncbi:MULTISPECIES: flagellar protein MotY [Alkalimonas]|uniref:OmpA family protein n=1 Tax=Alkalimonas mucilaginosa TaxID=3057676 RepID=A0ABU7JFW6_9GAMM|nr:OmpA family protein [Alkalimonas sp. MEB004]MEE2024555.1 OmpA family protein [Alkalimonas sp. MEB004]
MRFMLSLSVFLLCSPLAFAGQSYIRQYSAGLEQSEWQLRHNTPLRCEISHSIPGFGEAIFHSEAGKELNLWFELKMLQQPDGYALAEVLSLPPHWRPGEQARAITSMRLLKQFDGDLPKESAWTMLHELERGYQPTFYFSDWYRPENKVVASLNPVQFPAVYQQFNQCVSALLPYRFDDIAFTVLSYEVGGDQLTRESRRRLAVIAEYLKHDDAIEVVQIQGHTDTYGGRWMNEELSVRRAEKVKSFFVEAGLAEARIEVEGFGQRRNVAPNQRLQDRAINRRVVVQMNRP